MARHDATRGRGRPASGAGVVSREALVDATLVLLERGGPSAVTMRALARELAVDPMAAYHYFTGKDALLAAAAQHAHTAFRPHLSRSAALSLRLRALGRAYARFACRAPELVRYVAARDGIARASSRAFDDAFDRALSGVSLDEPLRTAARDALVDLVHGHALSGGRGAGKRLDRELELLCAGIEALAAGDGASSKRLRARRAQSALKRHARDP